MTSWQNGPHPTPKHCSVPVAQLQQFLVSCTVSSYAFWNQILILSFLSLVSCGPQWAHRLTVTVVVKDTWYTLPWNIHEDSIIYDMKSLFKMEEHQLTLAYTPRWPARHKSNVMVLVGCSCAGRTQPVIPLSWDVIAVVPFTYIRKRPEEHNTFLF